MPERILRFRSKQFLLSRIFTRHEPRRKFGPPVNEDIVE
jgi:hypothetical protein